MFVVGFYPWCMVCYPDSPVFLHRQNLVHVFLNFNWIWILMATDLQPDFDSL